MNADCRWPFGYRVLKRPALLCLIIMAALATSCGVAASKRSAELAVLTFRSQMDSERYEEIYKGADVEFRKNQTPEEIVSFLRAVHNKLGKVVAANSTGFGVNAAFGSGTRVAVSYETKFEGGKGTEDFVWRVAGEKTLLLRYHITSMELVTK